MNLCLKPRYLLSHEEEGPGLGISILHSFHGEGWGANELSVGAKFWEAGWGEGLCVRDAEGAPKGLTLPHLYQNSLSTRVLCQRFFLTHKI